MNELVDLEIGDVLAAAWGEYVYRGVPVRDGRVPLADRSNPTAWVLVSVDRLWVDYQKVGRIDATAPVPVRVQNVLVEEGPVRDVVVHVVQDVDTVAGRHVQHTDPVTPRSPAYVARTTLGALRPPMNSRGMMRGEDGAGATVILPTAETLYWLPCPVEGEPMMHDGVVLPVALPHVFHVTSSFSGSIYCPACYARKRGHALPLPVCVPDGAPGLERTAPSLASSAPEGTLSLASDSVLGHERALAPSPSASPALSEALSFSGDVGSEPLAQPEAASPSSPAAVDPRRDAVTRPPAAPSSDIDPELAAIAARIQERMFEPAAPRVEVADRVPPEPPPPPAPAPPLKPARTAWHNDPPRPNRADFERSQWWEERAAILEFEAGYPRELAELRAYEDMKSAHLRGEVW
jgi:hypothetical protein